jgi:uncharacterized membrane protein YgaE (UPF0421/DUF939 family)
MDVRRARAALDEAVWRPGRTVLEGVVRRPGRTARDRLARVRGNGLLVTQCGVAAGLAWLAATALVHHQSPFFAPIAGVIVLGASTGHRLRRTVELILGVAVGIFVGDLLIGLIGVGPAQLGLVVALAMAVALFVGSGTPLVTQAGSSAVLIATLYPPGRGVYYTRWFDALIGGLVGLGVHALLLPLNPLSTMRKATRPVLAGLAGGLDEAGAALAAGDAAAADAALSTLRGLEPALQGFRDALTASSETVAVAPIRWRARGQLGLYAEAAPHLDHVARNTRVLARRTRRALRSQERIPPELVAALHTLAEALRCLHTELERGAEPERTRSVVVAAVRHSALAYAAGVGFSGSVVVAQAQSIGFDLLRACGLDEAAAHKVVRRTRQRAESDAAAS